MSRVVGWRTYTTAGIRTSFRGQQQTDSYGLTNKNIVTRGDIGCLIFRGNLGLSNNQLVGITRDSTGATLGNCVVTLNQGNVVKAQTTSDASGNFTFLGVGSGPFFLVAYKAGSPDVAGTTVNTLQATVF